ncbi:MAG: DegT/DnrJ/EryC1/StrS aminotransferase family protein, partial [Desulfobacterales bacterium]|nr:DegT/DnrJ/EryC1/StrS aminotransferase family protein [Desulfobacterales bacterium]
MIPINKPIYDYREINKVNEVYMSGNFTVSAYSTDGGKYVQEFEKKLKQATGARFAVAVNSGTAAIECSLLAHQIGRGDKVIVPSLTFVATANAVRSVGAEPIFCDVDEFGQLSYAEARILCNKYDIKAIIIVDLYGRVSQDIKSFASLGKIVIEDACQALGTKRAGRTGDTGCFSFYASKVCTTMGLGGAIITDSPVLDSYLKVMRNQGMVQGDARFNGRNLLMGEANAAFGCVQLERLPSFIRARRKNMEALGFGEKTNGYMGTILSPQRDQMLAMFRDADIGAATYYDKPIHYHSAYTGQYSLPMTVK